MFRSMLFAALAAGPALAAETVLVDSATDQEPASPQGCVPISACVTTIAQDDRQFIESGVDGRTPDGVLLHDPQTIVHATLSDRAELQLVVDGLSLPFQRRSTVDIGAIQPGLKVSLFPEGRWLPSQAISVHVTMPISLDGTTDFEAWWYQSKNFGPVRLDLNLMSSFANVLGEAQVQSMGTFTVVYGLSDAVHLFAEVRHRRADPGARPGRRAARRRRPRALGRGLGRSRHRGLVSPAAGAHRLGLRRAGD